MLSRHLIFCGIISATALTGWCDVVYLNNGDRITGTVESISGGTVRIQTEYAGTLEIQRSAVEHMETGEAVLVEKKDGAVESGLLKADEKGQGIVGDTGTQPLPMKDIALAARDEKALKKLRKAERPDKWSGTVTTGLSLRTGNTDTTDFSLASVVTRKGADNTLTLSLSAAYGEAEKVLNTRRMKGEVKWQYYLDDRLYLFSLGSGERDDGRKLDLRWQLGGGAGFDFIDTEKRKLSADFGLIYNDEKWNPFTPWERDATKNARRQNALNRLDALWDNPGSGSFNDTLQTIVSMTGIVQDIRDPLRDDEYTYKEYFSLRFGAHYEQALFLNSRLIEDVTVLPNLGDPGEFRLLSELGLTTPITHALDLRVSLKSEYDSMADESAVESWDHTLETSLQYSF